MAKTVYMQELRDAAASFDMGLLRSKVDKVHVIVFRRANGTGAMIPIMEFQPDGSFAEILPVRLKTSMADGFLLQWMHKYEDTSKRGKADFATVTAWLKWYEDNGGRL